MEVTRDSISDVTVARIVGSLDGAYAQAVHDGIVPLLLDQQPILLDFSGVSGVSHEGFGTMLAIYRQAQAICGKVAIVGLSDDLHSTLSATGFLRFFVVTDDVASGLAALADPSEARSVAA